MRFKKGVFVLLIVLSLAINFILPQEGTETDKAYSCLETSLENNCGGTKSTKQNAFNLLAASYKSNLQSDCKISLKNKKKDNCWSETDTGSCNIKSTALAILSLNHVKEDVSDYTDWLLSKRMSDAGLIWYLEIDANNKTECDINGKKVTIENNKKISGTPPSGLVKAYNNYWFQINDLKKNYTISCDNDFITALLYQKPGSSTYYVSSETKSASEFDSITEKVNSYCFSTSTKCDYEGSLWASLVLAKLGEDISSYLPYITTMSDETENKKYFPSAFLYILTHSDDYYNEIISLQKSGNYWDESGNKFYDTALAILALGDISSDDVDRAKRYLLSVQKDSGCWQSDTSFILHSIWPKSPTTPSKDVSISYCEDFGKYCVSIGECSLQDTLNNFYCSSSAKVCCEKKFVELTCSEKQGVICELDKECDGEKVSASDTGECCIGNCILVAKESECEKQGYSCNMKCSENEEEKVSYSSSCDFGDICCAKKIVEEKKWNWLLIVLLIILIVLVLLAIIFRNQLKIWLFRFKSDYKSKGPLRPPVFPMPRQILSGPLKRPPIQTPSQKYSGKDKEFDETMRKLREMSK